MNLSSLFRKKSVDQIMQKVKEEGAEHESAGLSKHLGVKDLTAFGIAAIIGAGIFSTIGQASADGGPGVIFLFIFTAIACGFAAFAYAEFASMVPVSGSAYTYSYVAFGELTAWIIGWALIMEYGIGNITVAISWSDYFTGLLASINIDSLNIHGIIVPAWMTMDYLSAFNGYKESLAELAKGTDLAQLSGNLKDAYAAWTSAPTIGSFHVVADVPALGIIILITRLVYRGIRESRNAANLMVIIKLAVVLLVIAVGAFYVDTKNWDPFTPNGVTGILKGVSAVFFAYIGFDAISTTAEECVNPQRDLPRGMMWAIIICTVLYVAIALVLTGMVNYSQLAVGDPLAFVFQKLNLKWLSGIIAVSAVVAMASVLLVFQLGQPRIWMSMSRDGLLPKIFSRIHPKFHTPSFATIVTGFVVAVPALFMNLTMVTNLCSIGTLFAFVLVCAGVLKLQNDTNTPKGKFKTPYLNAKYISGAAFLLALILSWNINRNNMIDFLKARKIKTCEEIVPQLKSEELISLQEKAKQNYHATFICSSNVDSAIVNLNALKPNQTNNILRMVSLAPDLLYNSGWHVFKRNIPMWIFIFISLLLVYWSYTKNLSLIPVLGLESCLYMMAEIELENWVGFAIWLVIGLFIYFSFSYKNSKLNIQ